MTDSVPSALIIAEPGPLRDGLQALVTAVSRIRAVSEVDNLASALQMDVTPLLVLVDYGRSGSDTWMMVEQAKAKWHQAHWVFLTDTVEQQREVETAGADTVLLKGLLAGRLVALLAQLLLQESRGQEN
jgi:DNA-binding NarL/FixJ family response regulator